MHPTINAVIAAEQAADRRALAARHRELPARSSRIAAWRARRAAPLPAVPRARAA